jgi:hypothetical protein
MEVDQKHITTIRMHDAKGCDIRLTRDGCDCQLSLVSANNVVNITLAPPDLRKLWEQLLRLESEPSWAHDVADKRERSFNENMAILFAKMAQQMAEQNCKR